jgi:predicted component of type VI protein secretion system
MGLILRSPAIRAELGASDALQKHLDQWAGCGISGTRSRRLGGLSQLVPHARSAKGLERFLSRQLGIAKIKLDDAATAWVPNPSPAGLDGASRLDGSTATGSEIPVGGDRVEIRIGPLRWEQYRIWAREPGAIRATMRDLLGDFLPRPMQWEVVAILDPSTLPAEYGRSLGEGNSEAQACLGAAAWLGEMDPEPAVLSLS